MSEVRPSGEEVDGAAQLLASAHARVAAAAADLALPDDLRLTERQRHIIGAMLARLVRDVEDALRAALLDAVPGEALRAALSSAQVEIALPVLGRGGALDDPGLADALLRRAEEHRLHGAGAADNALLIELAGDGDEVLAGEAMGVLIAQGSRLDPFREPLLPRADLPAELDHHLVWTIAAALRRYMVQRHGLLPASADGALSAAATGLLSAHDEGEAMEARCRRLAAALRDSGRLDDQAVLRALTDAGLPLFIAILSLRTGFDQDAVWQVLSARSARGTALLLCAARIDRRTAGALLLALGSDEAAAAAQLDVFDGLAAEEAAGMLSLWRVDPGYRAAIARLGR
jgi:uncharacterized protein (DUF2336 family)